MDLGGSDQGLIFEGAGSVFAPLVGYGGARAEEVTIPPLTSPPLPCCRYPWWIPSWTTVWRPAQPRAHLMSLLQRCRVVFFAYCHAFAYAAFLLCFGRCALISAS